MIGKESTMRLRLNRRLSTWAGALVVTASSLTVAAPLAAPASAAPTIGGVATVGMNVELTRNNGWIPPDTMGSVGPEHIVEMINGNVVILDKQSGAVVDSDTLLGFWQTDIGITGVQNTVFDPRIVFDPASDRWFASVIDRALNRNTPTEQSNNLYLARSDTADPTGDWDFVQFNTDTVGGQEFHDFETLGLDADGVYSCTQDFDAGGNESCYSLPKADLLQATPTAASLTRFEASPAGLPGTEGSWQPAVDFGLSDGREALLGTSGGALQRTNIFGSAGAGATLGTPVAITGAPMHAAPPDARQPDDTDNGDAATPLENADQRFTGNVFELGNSLWAAHSVGGGSGNAAIRWYEINESTNTVLQTGLIADPDRDFIYPSIAVNAHGDVVIGYTCSGPALAGSVCVSVGTSAGGVTTFQAPAILASGTGHYYQDLCDPTTNPTCSERNRWGDYSATVIDPVDPCAFWTFQEYVAVGGTGDTGPGEADSGQWATRVTRLSFDGCVTDIGNEADLRVFKECKPDVPMPAGETGTCTILVENLGPKAAEAVGVVDKHLSNGTFAFGAVTTTKGTCSTTANPQVKQGTVTCALGTLASGASVTITVDVSAEEPQDINDVVSISSTTPDPDLGNNQATDGIQVIASADLSITKTGAANAVAGNEFTYTVSVDNAGPSRASGVVVSDDLPAGVSFVSATADVGSFTVSGGVLTWTLGTVLPGDPVRDLDITVRVKPDTTGQVENSASVTSDVLDPDTGNNRVTFTTAISAEAGLSITKTDSPDPVAAGGELTYTITVANGGPSTARDVVVTDTLPSGTTLISAVNGNGAVTCAPSGPGNFSCDVGDLAPGESVSIFVTVKVDASVPSGTVLTNHAQASSPTDPDGASVTTETLVVNEAELWIEKTGFRPAGNPSGALVYEITVHNAAGSAPDDTPTSGAGGPSDAQGVVVTDTLPLTPKKLVVQYLSPSCSYSEATHKVTCSTATIPAGTSVTYRIEVQVKGSSGTIVNSATVTSTTPDPVSENNTDTVANVVQGSTGKGPKP